MFKRLSLPEGHYDAHQHTSITTSRISHQQPAGVWFCPRWAQDTPEFNPTFMGKVIGSYFFLKGSASCYSQ